MNKIILFLCVLVFSIFSNTHNLLAKEIADPSNKDHVAAPIPGLLVDVAVTEGIKVPKGAKLCTIEAMKMETVIYADQSGIVERLCVKAGENIEAQQLLRKLWL